MESVEPLMEVKQAVIMVGGFGTRLFPLTKTCPKPAMPVLDRPFLKYLLDSLVEAGIEEVILACGYKSDILSQKIGDGSDMNLRIVYVDEDTPLGTAGAIKNVESLLDPVFVAANGDTLNFVDVSAQIETHLRTGSEVTISVAEVEDPSSSGVVLLDGDGYVTRFQEKPKKEEALSNLVNTGLYVINRSVLDYIPSHVFFDLSKDLFPKLLESGVKMSGHPAKGLWIDIGKPNDLLRMNLTMADEIYSGRKDADKAQSSEITGTFYLGEGASVRDSSVENSIISRNSEINHSKVDNSLIMEGCVVNDATITNSILGVGCRISAGVRIVNCVLEDGTVLEKSCVGILSEKKQTSK